ncbi:uncharacterized protein ACLA_010050 [Aspergillus clavatus NRRL 1]|uniref:Spindle pole body-associated protein cut12 domain-containing protein n=1 Tax=Aspergillus clavatus (strain ATCC 1007 / CBS 513.65 / DSM 816 / NCTC 3887 / NRRL 1 / QM 1276 / 107) TaxID=344612 RepID=A1CA14_ASPCL|nr:uncharacterized protein ACLA_010050 [Aspergillus clavatus NRRL 1]EAW12582.1 conserved hypothetical protein [Aspergillus clavatus NRRL 1]
MEPPETPAPVFAIRAFKSALFGTPGAEDEEQSDREAKTDSKQENRSRSKSEAPKFLAPDRATNVIATGKVDLDTGMNAMASPTKSILVTPGTASNRRKTVSFGDGVVDNERKRDDIFNNKSLRTPMNLSGNLSSQWISGSSDGKDKPRSKLTQALLDSRDKSPNETTDRKIDDDPFATNETKMVPKSTKAEENDDTINLEDPRSQSGKYWKAEFDNYRAKTTNEIRKLIQYRSAAKKFALMKETEASRLAKKLKEEESKVAEMERHVTQLASTMVTENAKADREQLVQDLTKQTALAMQYKHRVNMLRKLLERHGVVDGDLDDSVDKSDAEGSPEKVSQELRKTQQALNQANAKIDEMKRQQSEVDKLKELVQNSEQKASELARENLTLKQSLARVKQEMSKYEGRRKAKEAKLKQREIKLEGRIQEYRQRLKTASQEHREMEEDLRGSFDEERRRMQDQIDLLKLKVAALEKVPDDRVYSRHSYSPRKEFTGVQVYDFGRISPRKADIDETQDIDEPPSPSPRAKDRRMRSTQNPTVELDIVKAAQALGLEGVHSHQFLTGESPYKTAASLQRATAQETDLIPPSSPPEQLFDDSTGALAMKPMYSQRDYRAHQPTHTTIDSLARHLASLDSQQPRTQRSKSRRAPTKYSLDTLSGLPDSRAAERPGKRHSIGALQRESIPPERMLAAQARLKRKDQTRKSREVLREHAKTYNT